MALALVAGNEIGHARSDALDLAGGEPNFDDHCVSASRAAFNGTGHWALSSRTTTPTPAGRRVAADSQAPRPLRVVAWDLAVLESSTYHEAKAYCTAHDWPKPSIQSFGLRQRILEIAPLAARNERVFEVHPEVSFRELLGRALAPKRTAAGVTERRLALSEAGIDLPDLPYPTDDVLDAAVATWSAARFASGEALSLPENHPTRIGAIWR
ncbi:MAG: hypothetical protein C5B48_08595 [Candidatus Rokuibacteriota bacterium]|nr:MAG: hypothetical protein C5B48_08595 [Candidatus Rokubacteria bacterium]